MWRAIHGQPLVITGTGEETRDFTYVGDIVDGTMRLGVMPEALGDAFNLASGNEIQVIDIANMVNEIAGSKADIQFTKRRSWDKITRRCASIEKAKSILGYLPKATLYDGIKEVHKWILDNQDKIERDAKF
jgi:nucleoside-diphosphate-sugar epimerase